MGVETISTTTITCDNPACPGNSLDPSDRMGWTFVAAEVYGLPGSQSVFCSPACAATIEDVLVAEEEARSALAVEDQAVEAAEPKKTTRSRAKK